MRKMAQKKSQIADVSQPLDSEYIFPIEKKMILGSKSRIILKLQKWA